MLPSSPSELILTAEEQATALAAYQQEKWYELHLAQQQHKTIATLPIASSVTAADLYQQKVREAYHRIPNFHLTDSVKSVLKLLCLYFTCDPRFEVKGQHELGIPYSLNKGLLLFGPIGCGKTSLMRLFQNNPRQPYWVQTANQMSKRFSEQGYEGITLYMTDNISNRHRDGKVGVCFDDLGTEPTVVKYFGNEANVMVDILLARYDKFQRGMLPGAMTHLTTNLPTTSTLQSDGTVPLSLEQCYGNRVRSRMRELFNPIYFSSDSTDMRR